MGISNNQTTTMHMRTYTTKAYAELFNRLTEREIRSGKLEHEARTLTEESGTRQVNLTNDEAEEFEGSCYCEGWLDSDVVKDSEIIELIDWLEHEDLLEDKEYATPTKVTQLATVWEGGDGKAYVTLDGTEYRVNELVGLTAQFYAVFGDQFAQRDTEWEKAFGEVESRRQDIVELARKQHCSDYYSDHDYPEIDDDAKVSEGEDNGAYVQAWVWVPFEGTPLDKDSTE